MSGMRFSIVAYVEPNTRPTLVERDFHVTNGVDVMRFSNNIGKRIYNNVYIMKTDGCRFYIFYWQGNQQAPE